MSLLGDFHKFFNLKSQFPRINSLHARIKLPIFEQNHHQISKFFMVQISPLPRFHGAAGGSTTQPGGGSIIAGRHIVPDLVGPHLAKGTWNLWENTALEQVFSQQSGHMYRGVPHFRTNLFGRSLQSASGRHSYHPLVNGSGGVWLGTSGSSIPLWTNYLDLENNLDWTCWWTLGGVITGK